MTENKKFEYLKRLKEKGLKDIFSKIFGIHDKPEKVAFSFGLGVFIAFSPLLGTHLITVFLIILIFKINRTALLAGALVNNPYTIIPMYTAGTFIGFFVMSQPLSMIPKFSFSDFSSFETFIPKFKVILFPYLIGCTLLGIIAGVISYFVLKTILIKRKKAEVK